MGRRGPNMIEPTGIRWGFAMDMAQSNLVQSLFCGEGQAPCGVHLLE